MICFKKINLFESICGQKNKIIKEVFDYLISDEKMI